MEMRRRAMDVARTRARRGRSMSGFTFVPVGLGNQTLG